MSYFLKKLGIAIVIGLIWLLFFVEFIVDLIGSVYNMNFSGMLSVFIPVIIMTIILLLYLRTAKCKQCGKYFTYRKVDTSRVNSEDISVKVELNDYNTRHEVKGTHEQYIAGTRDTYRICYRCKNCGKEFYKKYSEDKQKI